MLSALISVFILVILFIIFAYTLVDAFKGSGLMSVVFILVRILSDAS